MDLLWTLAHAPAKQQMGRASSYPHLLPGEEKDFARRRHSGCSLSTPSLLPHTPAFSLPVMEEKFRFQSETRPSVPAHAERTHRKGAGQEHRVGHGGLLPLPARTQEAHVEKHRHAHTLALEAGGMKKQLRRPGVAGEKGPGYLVTDVRFAWIKKPIPNSSRFLTVRWRLSVVYEMVQKYTG